MPRSARVLIPHYPHHIVQRGHNRQDVFLAEADYLYYLDNLNEWKNKLGIKLYAWCLMTNHVHMIVEPEEDASVISQLMRRLAGRQTAFANKRGGRTGTLWGGRYMVSSIQRDSYLLACCRYVELNPVRANMVSGPDGYRWSSYRERTGLDGTNMLDLDPVFLGISSDEHLRIERYKDFVMSGNDDEELDPIRTAISRNMQTGGVQK